MASRKKSSPGSCGESCRAESCSAGRVEPGTARNGAPHSHAPALERFAAKLLFQFRVGPRTQSGKRRLCEERIVVLHADSAKQALTQVKRLGRQSQYRYLNAERQRVYFEFVGVMDLLHLGACDEDEVWYDIVEKVSPMERKARLIPAEKDLSAMRQELQMGEACCGEGCCPE